MNECFRFAVWIAGMVFTIGVFIHSLNSELTPTGVIILICLALAIAINLVAMVAMLIIRWSR